MRTHGSSLSLNLSQEGLNVGLLDYKNPYVVRKSDIFNGRTAALNSTSWNFLKKIGLSTTQATLFNNIEVWDSRGSSRISFSAEEIDEKNLGAPKFFSSISSAEKLILELPLESQTSILLNRVA